MSDTRRQTTAFYDAEAERYDEIRYGSKRGRRMDRLHKRILDLAFGDDLGDDARLLELGCGTGRLLAHQLERFASVSGIDLSGEMLNVARHRLAGRGEEDEGAALVRGDAYHLPFADAAFDAVYSILVINLLPDHRRALDEVRRVLKPGGRFVFSVPNLSSLYLPAGLVVNRRGRSFGANTAGWRHGHWFSFDEVRRSLERAGMEIEALWGQPPWTTWVEQARPLSGRAPGRWLAKSLYIRARLR